MRTAGLKIKQTSKLTVARVDSISYPNIGSIRYRFYGCEIDSKKWKDFHVDYFYDLKDGISNFPNIALGDIIQFNPNGTSIIVYERESESNAFYLTDRCNSHCIMCPQPVLNACDYTELSIVTACLINDDLKAIGITGGEPTIAWSGLIQLLSKLNHNFPDAYIELLTNARKLNNYKNAMELAEIGNNHLIACVPLYSDIYSIHDHIVGAKGAFWQTIEGLYNLERLNVPIELRIVVLRQNYKRLGRWAEFINRYLPFISHVAIMGIEPIGCAEDNIDQVWIDPLDYSNQLTDAIKILNRQDMNVSLYNHQLCTLPEELWQYSKKSISEWKNIFLFSCENCNHMHACGGFFASSALKHSRGICPILP